MTLNLLSKPIPSLAAIKAEKARRKALAEAQARIAYRDQLKASFADFVREAWPVCDPAPLVWGPHLDALCTCLQAVAEGRIQNLLINIPPGHAKSVVVSVLWPAWRWARNPSWGVTTASYVITLVMRDAVRRRELILSNWYTDLFRNPLDGDEEGWALQEDQNTKQMYKNTRGGLSQGTSVGTGTGLRADALIVDDPLSVDGAKSEADLLAANEWFFTTMVTRFNDMAKAERVVIMQRLHEQDVSGEILNREPEAWQHLCLPTEYDPEEHSVVKDSEGKIVFEDWRKVKGELLFPEKFPAAVVAHLKKSLGPYDSSGQLQQKPSPMGGGIFKGHFFNRRWVLPGTMLSPLPDKVCGVPLVGIPIPLPISHITITTDAAFKGTDKSDRVACGVWGFVFPNIYLLDLVWDRMDFGETLEALRTLKKRWNPGQILIEDAANGAALVNTLSKEMVGVIPVPADGSKVARILASLPAICAGNVMYPAAPMFTASPRGNIASVDNLVGEAMAFPKGRNDDAIDMQAYAVNKLLGNLELTGLAALAQATRGVAVPLPGTEPDRFVKPPTQEELKVNGLALLRGLTGPDGS